MPERIVILSQPGGTGRTGLVLHLGIALAQPGKRVLLVEMDPRGGLGWHLGTSDSDILGLTDCLMGEASIDRAIRRTAIPHLSLLTCGRLNPVDAVEFEKALMNKERLAELLAPIDQNYDLVLIDPPSGMGPLTRACLSLSSSVLVIAPATPIGVRTLPHVEQVIAHIQATDNNQLRHLGVVVTRVDAESPAARHCHNQLLSSSSKLLPAFVPQSEALLQASLTGQPIRPLAVHDSSEARGFAALAGQIMAGLEEALPAVTNAPEQSSDLLNFDSGRFENKTPLAVNEGPTPGANPVNMGEFLPAGEERWTVFLDKCLERTGAESAFMLDALGLTIANRGALGSDDVEGLGTRMMVALEQASQMGISSGKLHCVLVEFEYLWLTGIHAEPEQGEPLTIGILGPEPIAPEVRREIENTLIEHSEALHLGSQGSAAA